MADLLTLFLILSFAFDLFNTYIQHLTQRQTFDIFGSGFVRLEYDHDIKVMPSSS